MLGETRSRRARARAEHDRPRWHHARPPGRSRGCAAGVVCALATRRLADRHARAPLGNLAFALRMQGRYADAEAALREAIAIERRHYAPSSEWLNQDRGFLGDLLRLQHRYDEALAELPRRDRCRARVGVDRRSRAREARSAARRGRARRGRFRARARDRDAGARHRARRIATGEYRARPAAFRARTRAARAGARRRRRAAAARGARGALPPPSAATIFACSKSRPSSRRRFPC